MFRTHVALIVGAGAVAVALFVFVAVVTRARRREVVLALASGAVAALVNLGTDAAGHHFAWWRYPGERTPFGPLLAYCLLAPGLGALVLVAGRLHARYGLAAVAAMIVAFGIYGAFRDHSFMTAAGLIEWAPLHVETDASFQIRPGAWMALADALFEFSVPLAVAATFSFIIGGDRA